MLGDDDILVCVHMFSCVSDISKTVKLVSNDHPNVRDHDSDVFVPFLIVPLMEDGLV